MKNRIAEIDVLRGLLMNLVIVGHSIGDIDNIPNRYINSFHMLAFFFVSGMLYTSSEA